MKRLLTASVVLLSLTNCAIINSVTGGAGAGTVGREIVRATPSAVNAGIEIKNKCSAIGAAEVPYEEETQIGGAVALALANKTGGVFVEMSPDLTKPGMPSAAEWGGKKPTPGTGPKTDLNAYVNALGKYLARSSSRPTIDWTFMVMESESPNAFSAPGGYVVLTTGLLKMLDNEAQLAFVIAHEIGHVVHRDAINQYRTTKEATCIGQGVAGAMLKGSGFDLKNAAPELIEKIVDAVIDLVMKGNEKKAELEADKTAFEIMANSGYDVKEIEKLFKKSRGTSPGDQSHYFQEILVFSTNLIHVFMRGKRNTNHAVVAVCRGSANIGMVIAKSRLTLSAIEAAV